MEMDPWCGAAAGFGLARVANDFGSEEPDAVRARARVFCKRAAELDTCGPLVTTALAATASLSFSMEDAYVLSARAAAMDPTSRRAGERRGA
jgi:hypothetical protein